jgi:lysyl-tRNA synthetase class 2
MLVPPTSAAAVWSARPACDIEAARWTTLDQAFHEYCGIDLRTTYTREGVDRDLFARAAAAAGVRTETDDTWSDIFSRVLTDRIEPRLGNFRPEILCEYPTHEAALARPVPDDPLVAERFELYVCGVELANGFGELTEPLEQRRRFAAEMDEGAHLRPGAIRSTRFQRRPRAHAGASGCALSRPSRHAGDRRVGRPRAGRAPNRAHEGT